MEAEVRENGEQETAGLVEEETKITINDWNE